MKNHVLPAIFILFICLPAISLFPEEKTKKHTAGLELTLTGIYHGFSDPYSVPAGFGIFYQYRFTSGIPLFAGADVEWYRFAPMKDGFSDSSMVIPSFFTGYSFTRKLSGDASLSFSPLISAGQYFRSFKRDGKTETGSRPHLKGGVDIALLTEKRMFFSFTFFYAFFLDNKLVSMPGAKNRTGYAF